MLRQKVRQCLEFRSLATPPKLAHAVPIDDPQLAAAVNEVAKVRIPMDEPMFVQAGEQAHGHHRPISVPWRQGLGISQVVEQQRPSALGGGGVANQLRCGQSAGHQPLNAPPLPIAVANRAGTHEQLHHQVTALPMAQRGQPASGQQAEDAADPAGFAVQGDAERRLDSPAEAHQIIRLQGHACCPGVSPCRWALRCSACARRATARQNRGSSP